MTGLDCINAIGGFTVTLPNHPELALFVLRVTFGFLTFMHGYRKLANVGEFAGKWALSLPVAWAVSLFQTVGGLMLVIGLFTQTVALGQLILNIVILYLLITRKKEPFLAPGKHSWSIGLIYVLLAAVTVLGGNSLWSATDLL